jgi:hypothetical protein
MSALIPSELALRTEPTIGPGPATRAHLTGLDDSLVRVQPVLERMPDLEELLKQDHEGAFEELRRSEGSGRPVGGEEFVFGLEQLLKRPIARRSPGRKPATSLQRKQLPLLS